MDNITPKILTLQEAAIYLRVSRSWLARAGRWQKLGGVKLAGKILFGERELYDRIFSMDKEEKQRTSKKDKSPQVRLSVSREATSKSGFQNQDGSEGGGRQEASGIDHSIDYAQDMFDLLRTDKS